MDERGAVVLPKESLEKGPRCKRIRPMLFYRADDPRLMFWASCRTYKCLECAGWKAQRTATTMAWGADQRAKWRWVTLTQAPENVAQRIQKVRDLGRWSRARGAEWNFAWVTEKGSKTGMVHIHGLHWGDWIDQKALNKRWGAFTWLEEKEGDAGLWAGYAAKSAAQARALYCSKGAQQLGDWLDLSGGRPWRWSANYLPMPFVKAERIAHLEKRSEHVWIRATEEEYRTVLG